MTFMSRGKLAALVLSLMFLSGCGRKAAHAQRSIDEIAQGYVSLALALGERDPDSLDFAVVPASLKAEVHESYPTLERIAADADALRAELPADFREDETRERVAFLNAQLIAISARTAMLKGHLLPFDQEAKPLFGVEVLPDGAAAARGRIRGQVASMLPGGSGSSADRYARYQRTFIVPQDRLRPVMLAALAACRAQTVAHIALPPGESVELQLVRLQPWAAFSRYEGKGHSVIQLNLDMSPTVDEVLELACHEGYPGHHVFNTLRDVALTQGKQWPEAEVQPTFSPQSFVSEAAAAYAPRLAFSLTERIRVEREALFPLAALPVKDVDRYVRICELMRGLDSAKPAIAREYLDGRLDFVRAEEALEREVWMTHSECLLLYLNEYRSYMLAYTDGPVRVGGFGWVRYGELMTRPVYVLAER